MPHRLRHSVPEHETLIVPVQRAHPRAPFVLALLLPSVTIMRFSVPIASIVLLTACNRFGSRAPNASAAFNGHQVLTSALQDAMSNESLGKLAAKRARLPETRQFGQSMEREAAALRGDLASLEQRRSLPPTAGPAEKQIALRENLDILPGQVFDQGYLLAMVQSLTSSISSLDDAGSHDRELAEVATRHKAALKEQLKAASAALDHAGGSPFGFVP